MQFLDRVLSLILLYSRDYKVDPWRSHGIVDVLLDSEDDGESRQL